MSFPYPQGWLISDQANEVVFESKEYDLSLVFGRYDLEFSISAHQVMDQTVADLSGDFPDLEVVAVDSWTLEGELEAVLNGVVFTDEEGEVRWAFFVEMVEETTNYTLIMTGNETAGAELFGDLFGEIVAGFKLLALSANSGGDTEGISLILSDDFSDSDSGWATFDDSEASALYDDGAFRISVQPEEYIAWSSLPRELDDFAIEVTTVWVGGSPANVCGVFTRYQDGDNFYEFGIDGEGYFMVGKYLDGEWVFLVEWQESGALNHGVDAMNGLAVVCRQNELSFYANGELLATVVDDSFSTGEISLFAETFDEGGVEILFDEVNVWSVP